MTAAGPFIHSGKTNRMIMVMVLVGLSPSVFAAIWRYGGVAAVVIVSAVTGAWLVEFFIKRSQAADGSALVTGLIFALILPSTTPWWLAFVGGALAIGLGKHVFGGLGCNLFNPAALSRVLLMGFVPAYFFSTSWVIDGVSQASPLSKESGTIGLAMTDLLAGNAPGSLGQAVPLAVLVGGLLLVVLRAVDWRIPLTYLASIAFLALVLPGSPRIEGHAPWLLGNPLLHLVCGGSMIAAFFMLTDPVTAPFSANGRIAFAIVAALYTMLVRFYTPYPDGAALAVLFANATVPLIDRISLGADSLSRSRPSRLQDLSTEKGIGDGARYPE
jgi:electron transport complex protein RnfD